MCFRVSTWKGVCGVVCVVGLLWYTGQSIECLQMYGIIMQNICKKNLKSNTEI